MNQTQYCCYAFELLKRLASRRPITKSTLVIVVFFERLCFKNFDLNEFCLNYEIQCPAPNVSLVFSKS